MFKNSLSKKILFYFFIISLSITLSSYFVFEKITKEVFFSTEKEKAQLIAKTIKPLIEIDLYLGLETNINKVLKELSKNENILSVKILKNKKVVKEIKKNIDKKNMQDSIMVSLPLLQPNTKKVIGSLQILYSSKHYKMLLKKYRKTLVLFMLATAFLFLLYAYYLNLLISPLRRVAKNLEKYNPNRKIDLSYVKSDDEIGAIVKALNKMQNKIYEFTKKQESINKLLENKVQEKTEELRKQLYIDSLTGLPNRFSLIEDIKDMEKGSLIIINIDEFKHINDYFGHETGDKILKGFANRLRNLIKTEYPKIFRLSGDEFALLFNKKLTNHDLTHFINLLIKSIENMTFFHQDNELNIRVTIGATNDIEAPLEKADIALKFARKNRIPFKIYNENLKIEKQYKENIEWVKKIKKAIDKDGIVPYFQPIYNVHNMGVKGYECLMRLIDSDGNVVSPFKFLDIAKKSRFYQDLTKIMFEKSCEHFKNLNCSFSFNLSIEDILNDGIVEYIAETIKKYEVENRIIFEIVESEGIENYSDVSEFIMCVKRYGAKIAIDDFGSGYSNFEHLAKLDIDLIKIDGSLIKNIAQSKDALIVVESIVEYAKKKRIHTVAEFVSDEKIFNIVSGLNIDFVQGFYLGEPAPKTLKRC